MIDKAMILASLEEESTKQFVEENWDTLKRVLPAGLSSPDDIRISVEFYLHRRAMLRPLRGIENWRTLPQSRQIDPLERTARGARRGQDFARQSMAGTERDTAAGMMSAWIHRIREQVQRENAPHRIRDLLSRAQQLLSHRKLPRVQRKIAREIVHALEGRALGPRIKPAGEPSTAANLQETLDKLDRLSDRKLTQVLNERFRVKRKAPVSEKTVKAARQFFREIPGSQTVRLGATVKGRNKMTYKSDVLERALDRLEVLHESLDANRFDKFVIEETGYASVDLARTATGTVFQQLHDVEDIAPGKKGERIYGLTLEQAREYIHQSMSHPLAQGSIKDHVTLAVGKLAEALEARDHAFRHAVLAKEAAILLLGPRRLGGVYAEWQTSDLGIGLLSWHEQERLNLRVLCRVRGLDKDEARLDAQRFDLPFVNYVEVGCYGNIATACFRAVAEDELDGIGADEVLETGAQALRRILQEVAINGEQYRKYKIWRMFAMEAAVRASLGAPWAGKHFWGSLDYVRAVEIVDDVLQTEPSRKLQQIVVQSARDAEIEIGSPRANAGA